jgi:hypothetical protein
MQSHYQHSLRATKGIASPSRSTNGETGCGVCAILMCAILMSVPSMAVNIMAVNSVPEWREGVEERAWGGEGVGGE